jgi:hypothetical protein
VDQLFDLSVGQSLPQPGGSMKFRSLRAIVGNRHGDHDLLAQFLVEILKGDKEGGSLEQVAQLGAEIRQ